MAEDKKYIKQDEQSKSEQAINRKETDGKEINHQQEQKREQHQPRDNA